MRTFEALRPAPQAGSRELVMLSNTENLPLLGLSVLPPRRVSPAAQCCEPHTAGAPAGAAGARPTPSAPSLGALHTEQGAGIPAAPALPTWGPWVRTRQGAAGAWGKPGPRGRSRRQAGRPGGHESPPSRLHGGLWLLLGGAPLCDKAFLGRFHFAVRKPCQSGTSPGSATFLWGAPGSCCGGQSGPLGSLCDGGTLAGHEPMAVGAVGAEQTGLPVRRTVCGTQVLPRGEG